METKTVRCRYIKEAGNDNKADEINKKETREIFWSHLKTN